MTKVFTPLIPKLADPLQLRRCKNLKGNYLRENLYQNEVSEV